MSKFYIELIVEGYHIPVGNPTGYDSIDEAVEAAVSRVEPSRPQQVVHIYQHIATAFISDFGGKKVKRE